MQLNQKNFRELLDVFDLLVENSIYGWQVQLMVPMGRAADAEDLWLQPYDLLEIMPLVAEAQQRCEKHGIRFWAGDNVGYFGPYEHSLRSERSRTGHCGGCGGGVTTMGIEAHGDIKGCSAMGSEGFVGGNTRTSAIRDIWHSAPELRFTRDFTVDDLWGFCRSCYYAAECRGGCIWTAATLLGRRGNNPYCHHRALTLLSEGRRERLVRVQAASGRIRDRAGFELQLEDAPSDWVQSLPALPPMTR